MIIIYILEEYYYIVLFCRLEFAASQWLKLVTDAEDLFSKLINSQRVSADERNQIECWLCLKQECDECVASDEGTSLKDGGARTLDRIGTLIQL